MRTHILEEGAEDLMRERRNKACKIITTNERISSKLKGMSPADIPSLLMTRTPFTASICLLLMKLQ